MVAPSKRYTPPMVGKTRVGHTGLNLSQGYAGLTTKQATSKAARMDATALMSAKMIEAVDGSSVAIHECMNAFIEDPERLGHTTLSLLNLIFALTTQNGTNLEGFKSIIDHNLKTLIRDA